MELDVKVGFNLMSNVKVDDWEKTAINIISNALFKFQYYLILKLSAASSSTFLSIVSFSVPT